jgi:hypothetical protein
MHTVDFLETNRNKRKEAYNNMYDIYIKYLFKYTSKYIYMYVIAGGAGC